MLFELFDPNRETTVREGGNLPHWYQAGVTYFVTFRTEDSIPAAAARLWHRRRDDWLRRHGVDVDGKNWKEALHRLPRQVQREFHETFSRELLETLDRGMGACLLRSTELARTVADSLLHFDGDRYQMGDFVVMPNHVHLLVCLTAETAIEAQCYSWKKYSATRINPGSGRTGRFWQEESFDHLVRTPEQLDAIRRYIAANPRHAGLAPGEYLHYVKQ